MGIGLARRVNSLMRGSNSAQDTGRALRSSGLPIPVTLMRMRKRKLQHTKGHQMHQIMTQSAFIAVLLFPMLIAGPLLASPCGDAIRALEPRVDDAMSKSVALSSGGQGVAASREAQAMQAENNPPASGSVQKLPEHDAKATAAATPLAGGDNAVKARAALSRAQAQDREGDAIGCSASVEEARRELGPAQ
jgi:hypothetical protein